MLISVPSIFLLSLSPYDQASLQFLSARTETNSATRPIYFVVYLVILFNWPVI